MQSSTYTAINFSDRTSDGATNNHFSTCFDTTNTTNYQKLLIDYNYEEGGGAYDLDGGSDYTFLVGRSGMPNPVVALKLNYYSTNNGVRQYCQSINCDIKVEIIEKYFNPNWAADLKSGEMIAAQGKFMTDANGNVSVEGTIKAKNLYREIYIDDKEETYYYYCTKVPESSDANSFGVPSWDSSEDDFTPFNYTVGEYYKSNEIDDYWKDRSYYDSNSDSYINYLTKCTGYADFIIIPPSTNNTSNIRITLPDPDDFPNKVVEIRDYRYKNDQYNSENSATYLGILTASSL